MKEIIELKDFCKASDKACTYTIILSNVCFLKDIGPFTYVGIHGDTGFQLHRAHNVTELKKALNEYYKEIAKHQVTLVPEIKWINPKETK